MNGHDDDESIGRETGAGDGATDGRYCDQKEAGKRLAVSVRQLKRIVRRYRTAGLPGLIGKRRGIPSNRRLAETARQRAVEAVGAHYRDFGPTLAREKLAERHDHVGDRPRIFLIRNIIVAHVHRDDFFILNYQLQCDAIGKLDRDRMETLQPAAQCKRNEGWRGFISSNCSVLRY